MLLVGLVALLVLAGCSGAASASPGQVNRPVLTDPPVVTMEPPWAPSDMTVATGEPNVAWRWVAASEATCTYSSATCWEILAVSRRGCPDTLYIELSVLDASGTAIGFTNDSVGAVQAMQQARLTFDTFEEAASKARVAKVSCY